MRPNHLRALLLGLCTAALPGQYAFAQVQSIERRGDGTERAKPDSSGLAPAADPIQPARPQAANESPDTSGVWHFVRTRDLDAARRELARLRNDYPRWQPPADLLDTLAGRPPQAQGTTGTTTPADNTRRDVDHAYARQLDAAVATLKSKPDDVRGMASLTQAIMQRRDAGAAERLGWAYNDAQQSQNALTWFARAQSWGAGETASQGRIRALALGQRWDEAQTVAGANTTLCLFLADQAAERARLQAEAGNWTAAIATAAIAERNGRPETTAGLGWIAMKVGATAQALKVFGTAPGSEDAVYGTLLALDQSQASWQDIERLCATSMRSERHKEACGNALAGRALATYRAEDWTQTIAIDEAMRKLHVERPGISSLAAWSHYRRNEYGIAAGAFDRLYRGGEDVGDGLVLSSIAAGQGPAIAIRAKTDPKLAVFYRAQVREQALARKKFQLASTLGDGKDTTLANVAAPEAEVAVSYRNKSGSLGQDHLSITNVAVRGAYGWSNDRVELGVTEMRVKIGQPAVTAPVGSLLTRRFAATTAGTLYAPVASWQRDEVDQRWTITAGLTPIGGQVTPTPAGRIQWERDWSSLIATVTLKAAPVFDSLLSMSGLRDPSTGQSWGRVVETGPDVGLTYLITDSIAASGSVSGAVLTGRNVASNSRVGVNLSVNYQFKPAGFDYVRVGPNYAFQHNAKNQNFFTFGNGGYYSPDQLHSLGAFVDFQTEEGRRWQISGRVSGGWTHKVEATAVRFPLADDGTRFTGARGSEFTTDSMLRGSVLLGDHLRLGAMGRYTQAPSGKDYAAGLTLSVPFGARSATFSTDLPRLLDRSWP